MLSNYVIWTYKSVDGACALKDLRGLEKSYRLNNGTPLAAHFPPDVELHMHPDYPNDILVPDNVLNADLVIVASPRLQECVRSHSPPEVEYLPVRVIDHKGRLASAEYAIIHPLHPVDCIDRQRSVFRISPIKPDSIKSFEKLVLDESRIPRERMLFRMQGFWGITLVRRDLATAISSMGFTGLEWLGIDEYPRT